MKRRGNIQHGQRRRPPAGVVIPVVILIAAIPTLVFLMASLLQVVIG